MPEEGLPPRAVVAGETTSTLPVGGRRTFPQATAEDKPFPNTTSSKRGRTMCQIVGFVIAKLAFRAAAAVVLAMFATMMGNHTLAADKSDDMVKVTIKVSRTDREVFLQTKRNVYLNGQLLTSLKNGESKTLKEVKAKKGKNTLEVDAEVLGRTSAIVGRKTIELSEKSRDVTVEIPDYNNDARIDLKVKVDGVESAEKTERDQSKKDLEKLQGRWAAVSIEVEKKKAPDNEIKDVRIVIKKDRITIGEREATITLDTTKKPWWIDITTNDLALKGIYELDGDQLKICFNKDDRPTEFATKPNHRITLFVLKRTK